MRADHIRVVLCALATLPFFPGRVPAQPLDSAPLATPPRHEIGRYGYDRYVYWEIAGEIQPVLVEGPLGRQVRCQTESLPCSYLDLKALHESGREPPPELAMSRTQLAELVGQLDRVAATLQSYTSLDQVCQANYHLASEQTPNMGIHMVNLPYTHDGFDPAKPEILLLAFPGGERLSRKELVGCSRDREPKNRKWLGDPNHRVVGAAFVLGTQLAGDRHPDGFAGPLDNWHIHYNTCTEVRADALLTREECIARGGQMLNKVGWMIHAYAHPDYDNQHGVFAMYNPTIPPTATHVVAERAHAPAPSGAATGEIRTFAFEPSPINARVGQPVVITNHDDFGHTVTSGQTGEPDGRFESGLLARGENAQLVFDRAGEYDFHCQIHPFMRGRIQVTGGEPAPRSN